MLTTSNRPVSDVANKARSGKPLDFALARTAAERRKAEREADKLIAANDNVPKTLPRVRYRGGRPALNWLEKQDRNAAASLWLLARCMLPDAANDNVEPGLTNLDRRKGGKPRGPDAKRLGPEEYLSLPGVRARLGDPEPTSRKYVGWHSDVVSIKPQRTDHSFGSDCRFGFCAPAIAEGAFFLGAAGGLGQAKAGKRKGEARRPDEPDLPDMPDSVFVAIEAMLACADLATVGKTLGYKGGYADRAGKRAMREAGRWAVATLQAA